MAEMSDADVFGTSAPSVPREMSDSDVFGAAPKTSARQMSDAEVFGATPNTNERATIVDYLGETGKAVARGGIDALITSRLKGIAGQIYEPDTSVPIPAPPPGGYQTFEQVPEIPVLPVTKSTPYRAAQAIEGAVEPYLGDRNILNPVVRDIAQGVGSVGGNIAGFMIPGTRGFGISTTPAQGAGESVDRAVQAGATDEQVRRAAGFGNIAGASEFLDSLLVHSGTAGRAYGLAKRVGLATLKGAFIEGGQEGLQQFIQNVIAKGIYKPSQDLSEDVAYNALIGGIVGGGVSGALGTRGQAPQTAPTEEMLQTSTAPPVSDPSVPTLQQLIDDLNQPPVETPVAAPVQPQEPAPIKITPLDAAIYGDVTVGDQPPVPPRTMDEEKAVTLSPTISEFLEKNTPPIETPLQLPKDPTQLSLDDLLGPAKEEINAAPGANLGRLAKLLGPNLYDPKLLTSISVKEMFQNSFDAIKSMLEKGQIADNGNIDIEMNPDKRTISIRDDGSGMTSQTLANQFLQIAGTKKESTRASGGLGIAKMAFLFGNKSLKVTTMRDGKVSELITTGEELFTALEGGGAPPRIQVRSPTPQDMKMFPRGHGTRVETTVPMKYKDTSTGADVEIPFSAMKWNHPVLESSPLFDNINVRFNGRELELGTNFPLEDYTQFSNVKFDWGTARIYVTREPDEGSVWGANTHILSNGLWQFSTEVKADPAKPYGKNIPFKLYIDVNSRVSPEEAGYPFALNRQQFTPQATKDFANILNYIGLLYNQADLQNSASNFGSMQFLDYDVDGKRVTASETVKVEPKVEVKDNPFTDALKLIKKGKSFTVNDGQLVVDGVEVPELDPEKLADFKINYDELKIDQSEIDPNRIILHDNMEIVVSSIETRSVTEYGRERFGKRFDEYMFALGAAFRELRDVVVKGMPGIPVAKDRMTQIPFGLNNEQIRAYFKNNNIPFEETTTGYEELGTEGIGISFDREYRGVSIKLPFSGMFLNPAVPEYNDPLRAAVGMVGTMIHELAHHKVRGHDAAFPAEMQRIIIMLDVHPTFNLHGFKQKVINIVAAYEDIHTHMNEVFTSGDFTIQPRGKRFQDSSAEQVGDGGLFDNLTGPRGEPESGSQLSYWVAASQTIPPSESRRSSGAANQTGRSGAHGPSDNGRARNYSALKHVDPGISAPPQQPETKSIRQGVNNIVPPGPARQGPAEAAAHADRMNWFYKWMTGLTELLDANPYFTPLRNYTERVRMMHNDETKVHDAALRITKDWRSLGEQNKNLEAFILELQDMPYLTQNERAMQLWRHPTQQEFNALVQKHKLSQEALGIYNRLRNMDETFLKLIEQNAVEDAMRRLRGDPVKLAARLDEIRTTGRLARAQPFFPFTHFGRYYLVVKDAAGKPVSFETFEPKRFVGLTVKRAEKYQMARKKILESKVPPGHTVTAGVLPETAEPLIGMPTLLLQAMQTSNIGLTPEQIEAIKMLQLQRNPAMSLKHRAQYGEAKLPGYSLDLQRSFARYYFHGGRYYAKSRHSWALRGHIGEAQLAPGNKAGLIASYMSDHLQNTVLDARGDFGYFKGAIFLWAMGYVPAAASQNLTQTPMITLPFLAAKFGDAKSAAALVRAMTQVSNFYRRGTYDNMTGFEFQALSYGIKTGRISETQAPELAGIASGGNLINGQGGTRLQRYATTFIEKAAFMFEMAEQFNRRVAYRAALKLATDNPNSKFVDESVQKYQTEYQALLTEFGGNQNQARAVVSAIHAVDQTQYIYARYARPRFMRGPLASTLFVFKRYMQSTLVMLGHNKSDVLPRYLVIAMLMGGLGGVPGWEDMVGIFNAFAKWYFGKDVNVQRLVREYVLQWFDGQVPPDLVLHGLARRGFGLPALLDTMGVPFPTLDRSKALSMGNILPVEIGKILEPTDKQEKMIADQTQKASGAVFSVGFNMYKALFDKSMEWGDPKRWERAVPRALGSVSRSYRAFSEGRERAKGGPDSAPTIIRYDIRDTEQMMEALALAGGYQPLRLQAKWDSIIAKAEVTAFYDLKRKGLLEQFFEARKGGNKEEIADVRNAIVKFNQGLPDYARGKAISGETIQRSMSARERSLQARESGIPAQRTNVPLARHVDTLFPEATIDVRKVR